MLLLLLRTLPPGTVIYSRAPAGGGYSRASVAGQPVRSVSGNTVRQATPNTTRIKS